MFTNSIDRDSGLKVVNAAQNEIQLTTRQTSGVEDVHEMFEIVHRGDVIVVSFDFNIRIYMPYYKFKLNRVIPLM